MTSGRLFSKRAALTFTTVFALGLGGCSSIMGSENRDAKMLGGDDAAMADSSAYLEQDVSGIRERRFGEGTIPVAEGEGAFRDIAFGYDSDSISDQARQDIEYNVEVLKLNPDVQVQLEGHCDERGTAEYNMALGDRRARSVQEVLSSYGIPMSQMTTISYGEEVPLEYGENEEAWSKNRRVHFSPYRDIGDGNTTIQ